jgi:pyruvate kinase
MQHSKNTKIIATVGPACQKPEILKALINEGVDVFRINASHSTPESLEFWFNLVRRVSMEMGRHIAILIDLQGPRIRTGKLKKAPLMLKEGQRITMKVGNMVSDGSFLTTTCKEFTDMVKKGDTIMIDNGTITLKAESSSRAGVVCRVVIGGPVGNNKGINLPSAPITLPALTEKDLVDLAVAAKLGADYVALSFVRTRDDIMTMRRWMQKHHVKIPIIAKIEKPQAVKNIRSIMALTDGIMVARGDLGIEMGVERVPRVQKQLIDEAEEANIPVITATQMLETMIDNAQPTRAEVSDIANAVFDGTDAVMLSGETSVGKYPVEAVRIMRKIIQQAEGRREDKPGMLWDDGTADRAVYLPAIAHAAYNAAQEAKAKAIVIFTRSGRIARHLSKLKPGCGMIAATDSMKTLAQLSLLRGVQPIFVEKSLNPQEMIWRTDAEMLRNKILKKGDVIIVISGPWALPGSLFMLAIHRVGETQLTA